MNSFVSQKFRFWSFVSMLLLVFVHGYNVEGRYLQPMTTIQELINVSAFFQYFTANGLFRFRIPMLFVISGYLFAMGDTTAHAVRIRKRIRTLLVPYVLWGIIALGITWLFQFTAWGQWAITTASLWGESYTPIEQRSWHDIAIRWVFYPLAFQLWFIRCLFMYNLLYPFFVTILQKAPKTWFSIVGIVWLLMMHFYIVEGEGLLFFTLGIWMQKNNISLEQPRTWMRLSLMGPLWIVLLFIKTWLAFNGKAWIGDFATESILILLHKSTVVLGLIVCWFGSDMVVRGAMRKQWFVWCSSFSFIVYALHVPLINYMIEPSLVLLRSTMVASILSYLLLPVMVIAICISVGFILRTLLPSVYAILTGDRGIKEQSHKAV